MRLLHINSSNFGSTGNIMINIAELMRKKGNIVYTSCPDGRTMHKIKLKNHIMIGSILERNIHLQKNKLTGKNGCYSKKGTKVFLKKIDEIQPNIIHLHNLHNCYINLEMLFDYVKEKNIKVVWTLHDCWSFTGQCPHFTMVKCGKWQFGCYDCPQYHEYPGSLVDNTRNMYHLKKQWFTEVQNLTIITPSQWLADLVKQSYLKEYPVQVINNGIDLSIFKPIENNFMEKYNCKDKIILLGVAFIWEKRKGFDVFIELAKRLDKKYQIVLVGTDYNVDKELPNSIISIPCTQDQNELAQIYTAADIFVNPTREDNFPTTNLEALACGTPVITFNTGGSPECIDETCGSVVDCDDIDAMELEIIRVATDKPYSKEACLKRAIKFDMNYKFMKYIELYNNKDTKGWANIEKIKK